MEKGELAEVLHFPSKRDAWIVLLIWAASAASVAAAIAQLDSGATVAVKGLVFLVCLAAPAFMLWVLYGTDYRINREALLIRSGPFRFKVPLAEIDRVTPSRNPLSSPACSLDRLHIRYRGSRRSVLVSPRDKPGFLRALVERCPQLTLVGDRVERASRA